LGQTQFRLLKAAEILAMPMEGCAWFCVKKNFWNFFNFKLIFLIILNHFILLISKINFLNKKYFEKNPFIEFQLGLWIDDFQLAKKKKKKKEIEEAKFEWKRTK
jgi:hypothetical protein